MDGLRLFIAVDSYIGGQNDYQPDFLFSPRIPAMHNRVPAKDPRILVKRPY